MKQWSMKLRSMKHEIDNDERKKVERFALAVDQALKGQPPTEAIDESYQADLEMANKLSRVSYTPDPRFKMRLRSNLIDHLYTEKKEVRFMFGKLFRSLLVAGMAAVLLFSGVLAFSPEARAASRDLVARFTEVNSPWELLPSIGGAPAPGAPGQEVFTNGDPAARKPGEKPGLPSGLPQPGVAPTRDLISVQQAQAGLSFQIRVPASLPAGYKLLGAVPQPAAPAGAPGLAANPPSGAPADLPKVSPPQSVILVFGNDSGDTFMLTQMKMPENAPGDVLLPAGAGSVQEVTVNGIAAQYVAGQWTENGWVSDGNYQLRWETADGILYDLISSRLQLDDLLSIAESLK